jgi:hypothetical protein
MGQAFKEENGLVAYLETSALSGLNVEEAFSLLGRASIS